MCFSLYPQRLNISLSLAIPKIRTDTNASHMNDLTNLVWIIELSPTEEKYRKNPFCRSAISPIRSLSLASQVNMYGNNGFVGRIAGMILRPYIPGCSADSSARRR